MRYLGIDYGSKRVGLALSDEGGTIAFPRETRPNDASLLRHLATLVEEEGVERIVVGDTRSFGAAENTVTAEAEAFCAKLAEAIGVPITRAFEAFSSIEASRFAPEGKGHDDAAAAAIILQRFLDMRGPHVG